MPAHAAMGILSSIRCGRAEALGGVSWRPVRRVGTAATEVLQDPENRRYVDSDTKAGDAGTEEWADALPGSGDPVGRGPLADPVGTTDDDGIVDGSPADEFVNDPDAIDARNDKGDRA